MGDKETKKALKIYKQFNNIKPAQKVLATHFDTVHYTDPITGLTGLLDLYRTEGGLIFGLCFAYGRFVHSITHPLSDQNTFGEKTIITMPTFEQYKKTENKLISKMLNKNADINIYKSKAGLCGRIILKIKLTLIDFLRRRIDKLIASTNNQIAYKTERR